VKSPFAQSAPQFVQQATIQRSMREFSGAHLSVLRIFISLLSVVAAADNKYKTQPNTEANRHAEPKPTKKSQIRPASPKEGDKQR
jgi:hypothetical protein